MAVTDVVLTASDLAVLIGVAASLEGYLALGDTDPTARAHAIRHLAQRAAADLTRELRLTDPGPAELAGRVHEIHGRLRAQLTALDPDRG